MRTTCQESLKMVTAARALGRLFAAVALCCMTVSGQRVEAGRGSSTAKALLRDCDRGYLLNCSFRAIRAYLWKKKVPLTGWETDDRGGVWESSPVGFFPGDFGFHVDWFRLNDNSTDHAVTIRHQIARQTSGIVTWEFRFMMPEIMEGAAWQLRDLEAAAVSILVRHGKLCCESPGKTPLSLKPIRAGCQYGVRAIVDLTRKNARIFVDGELVASDVSLLNQAETLDYVLITTGSEAVGQLYLPVVNVHKGYTVNERFLVAGKGRLPDDWRRVSDTGKVSVEEFRCAARPDVFSLRLDEGGTARREFAAIGKRTVLEYRILLSEKRDGASVSLHGRHKPLAVFQTVDGNLCYVHSDGRPTVLVHNYRANFWYAIKMIADPKLASAECQVNGKPAASDLPLRSDGGEFARVQFAAPPEGTMWLDDVCVYPWRDYPVDYVPQPKPVNQADSYLVGAVSCSLWKEGDAYAGWDYVYPYADKRKPYLGWYDEGNPEVADWEIKWQVEHGIDFEQYCWYRPNDAVNHPIKNGVLEHGIREGLFNARYSSLKRFTIMYTNDGAGETNPDDWRRHVIPYLIEYFFKDPRYLKVDGKPVFAIYWLPKLLEDFGGEEGVARALRVLREECKAAGFPGIVILCEERNANPVAMRQMKAIGFDYCYCYTWGTGDTQAQRRKMEAQRQAAAAAGLGVVPSFSVGWDPSPWGAAGDGWPSVDDYRALAQWTKDTYMPTLPTASLGTKMVLLPNWNEFGEGHFLMPSTLAGFGYVDALREVFTGAGRHRDVVPAEAQRRRFNVLYPRD